MKMYRRRHECAEVKMARWPPLFLPFAVGALPPALPHLSHAREVRASVPAAVEVFFNTPSHEAAAACAALEARSSPHTALDVGGIGVPTPIPSTS